LFVGYSQVLPPLLNFGELKFIHQKSLILNSDSAHIKNALEHQNSRAFTPWIRICSVVLKMESAGKPLLPSYKLLLEENLMRNRIFSINISAGSYFISLFTAEIKTAI
jgi:hypothetical protein